MSVPFPAARVRQAARDLGFSGVGLIRAAPSPRLEAYLAWIAAGMHGDMGYLARPDRVARRRDLNVILPGVRALIVVTLDYATAPLPPEVRDDPRRGRIACYAWGADYHAVLLPRLEQLAAWLRESAGEAVLSRAYVDTGAILERDHAQGAGLGFIGKNTLLIDARRGSYFFLGELLTTLDFDAYDSPGAETLCAACTRCLGACPTGAFPRPYVLDARRCISALTIELKGAIPPDLRPLLGRWVFGCDVCQEVCPFTRRFARPSAEPVFWPARVERAAPLLDDLLALDAAAFATQFGGSPIARIGRDRLVRNACVAAGNSGVRALLPVLERLAAEDESTLVRQHAAWGVAQLRG